MLRAALLLSLVLPWPAAVAWPVDVYVDVPAGKEEFRKLAAISWAEVEDASIATAEVLPSGELLLTGKAPGRTLVLLYAEGKFAVWRVRVSADGKAPASAAPEVDLKKACGKVTEEGGRLSAFVATDACRTALMALFQTDRYSARDVELTFDLPALQAQLADIQKGVDALKVKDVTVAYSGAGLVLKGTLTPEQHKRVLWELFRRSVGRVPLDDRSEVSDVKDAEAP